jgi:hypothetical protein
MRCLVEGSDICDKRIVESGRWCSPADSVPFGAFSETSRY